jgi:ankyrin repeat protein
MIFSEKRHQKELQFRLVGAVERGDTKLLQELIDKGVNTNATIQLVKTPLTLALDQSEVFGDIVAILLNAKDADPNLSDHTPWGLRPLHLVARNGNLELAKLFLEGCKANVCDIDAEDKGGASPIHFAARFGHYEVVKYLVEKSADLTVADNSGRTALHRACECQHIEIAKFLINSGIDVNITDNFGWTPLFHSVFFCNAYVVEFLLQNNARTDLWDINGKSLLDLACYNNINYHHMGNYLQKVALATSFNFYERSRSIPSEQLLGR